MTSIRTAVNPTFSYPVPSGLKHPLFGSNAKLDAFSAIADNDRFDLRKYGPLDLQAAYDDLSPKAQRYIDRELLPNITLEELYELKNRQLLGLLEETADCLFEMYTLEALRQGIFAPEKLQRLMSRMARTRRTPDALESLLDSAKKDFSKGEIDALRSRTGLKSEQEARTLLALMGLKFASFRLENPDYDIAASTRTQLLSEARELIDHLPRLSLKRAAVLATCWLYAHSEHLPMTVSRHVPQWFLQQTLDLPVTVNDLNFYSKLKQLRRQEMHYLHPDFNLNTRKSKVKFFEVLQEGALLKQALSKAGQTVNPEFA